MAYAKARAAAQKLRMLWGSDLRETGVTVSRAGSFEPAADVDLGVSFAAIVTRAGRVRSFLGPLEDRQLRTVAVDDEPAHGILALLLADFTSIDGVDHRTTSGFRCQVSGFGARVQRSDAHSKSWTFSGLSNHRSRCD